MSDDVKHISADTLRQMGHEALARVGVREDIIHPVVDGLVWTSLRGVDSHGIRLLPHYVEGVKGGRLNPDPKMVFERTAAATGTLDADHTFGHAAGVEAMKHAIELARDSGIGAVSVRNSSHCGALSYFAHAAAEQDMIGMAFTHATARVKSPGSSRAFFGNNPLCLVAPMRDEAPFCFDAATTSTTFNAVKAAAAAGKTLPPGLVADADGNETTDPNKAEQLLPIGDYKGFGLSMMVDILCAVLSGMPNGNNVSKMFGDPMSKKRELGQFYCALRIDAFRDVEEFKAEMQEMAERVRNEPAIDPEIRRVMVPGDPEKKAWAEFSELGINVPQHVMAEIRLLRGE
ncbi:ureidoglycolate dehydrogenase (NAD+) [Thioalkalivibrio sp. ALE21]|uniref:Ldh family oxidoreductase n=1 Tax=Thioalkalivibrio sp. ALE21 TaxID=1158175 RepID=UPI000D8BFE40|nr:Ldh family oxidoreductase [Thioalkalivibrio sp. ALE21]PYF99446.1 ureidoglycolate dehydrogenase (NAD+) [Thioalkalivibrio sp. ALE21]